MTLNITIAVFWNETTYVLKMVTQVTLWTLAPIYQTTWCHISEDHTL